MAEEEGSIRLYNLESTNDGRPNVNWKLKVHIKSSAWVKNINDFVHSEELSGTG